MDDKVVVRASSMRMGQTDECQTIHMFYLFVNLQVVCSNASFSPSRYDQLYHIYESNAMILSLALDKLNIQNEIQFDFKPE